MKAKRDEAAAAIQGLGFTELEARIYVDLLRSGPLTGYRIAQHVGKAAANTYKALEVLTQRGIVSCEDGPARLYRATPYTEVTAALSRDFARRSDHAAKALAAIDARDADDRIYRLADAAQIYARAEAMIASATTIVVADAFPETLDALASALEAAAARGVQVVVQAYAPLRLEGVRLIEAPTAAAVRKRWPGAWLNLSVDGSSALIAHVHDADATVGIWTENAYVAWTLYSGIASEAALAELRARAAREPKSPLAVALRDVNFVLADIPGRAALYMQMVTKKGKSK